MGGNEKELAWLLLWARLKFNNENPSNGLGASLELASVTSRGGVFASPQLEAENDANIAACAAFLSLFLFRAISCANSRTNGAVLAILVPSHGTAALTLPISL